jgi:tetratricopeptide (TPR) repeat protein
MRRHSFGRVPGTPDSMEPFKRSVPARGSSFPLFLIGRRFRVRAFGMIAVLGVLACVASCVSSPPRKSPREKEAVSLSERGMEAFSGGCLDKAETLFRASLELHRSMDDQEGVARDLNDLAVLYADRSRPDKALALLSEAESINRRREAASALLTNLLNRGEFCLRTGDIDCAERALGEATVLAEGLKDRGVEVKTLEAFLLLAREDAQGAEDRFRDVLNRIKSRDNVSIEAAAHLGMARVCRETGRIPEAVEHAELALDMDKRSGCWRCVGDDLVLLGDLAEEAGRGERASEYLERAFYVVFYLGREDSVRELASRLKGEPAEERIQSYLERGEREGFNAYCP